MTEAAGIDIADKFAAIEEHWRPRVAAQLNGQDIRLVKIKGAFPWHSHPEADEMFLVWKGGFRMEFRDRAVDGRRGRRANPRASGLAPWRRPAGFPFRGSSSAPT